MNKVVVEQGVVRIITVGIQGPPGPVGAGADTAYVDAGDTASRARANHTGTQLASTISDFPTAVDARVAIQKGVANGLATLGSDNKVPSAQLPAIAITDTFPVASQAAMLALTAEVGDVAVRTDLNKSFILRVAGASTLANWQELLTPTDAVLSVNGQTGAVSLTAAGLGALVAANNLSDVANPATARTNLGAAAAVHTHAETDVTGLVADLAAKEPTISAGTTSQYWRGDKSWQTLDKSAVGLGNVDNTSDANKPVSTATQTALNLKAALASPALTGTPTAPTASPGTNSTQIATTAFLTAAVGVADGTAAHLAGAEAFTGAKTFNAGAFLDKGNQVFNVKAYGAVGDGMTDDTAKFQDCFDDAGAAGGEVWISTPPVEWLINGIVYVPSNVRVASPGLSAKIKLAAGARFEIGSVSNVDISNL
jgi:hypothetical protein